MNKLKNFLQRSTSQSSWIFLLPGGILLALFLLPLLALFIRSISEGFFNYAFSEQAWQALRLSLFTSTITTLCAVIFGTPLAYILAHWKFKFKSWIELLIDLPLAAADCSAHFS
jgi:ABC-type sulfate transport system permease component